MPVVVYLGKDLKYWESIKVRLEYDFKSYEFEFHDLWHNSDRKLFQQVLLKIAEKKPDIIFLDYSEESKKVLTVARSLPRVLLNTKSLVGLWSYIAPKELMDEANITGVPVNHIKSGEIGPITLQAMHFFDPENIKLEQYSKAEVYEGLTLSFVHQMKLGYMTKEYLHLEHDLVPPMNPCILRTNFFKEWPIDWFEPSRRLDQNYYFHFKHSSDFCLVYEPMKELKEDATEKDKEWFERDKVEITELRKKRVSDWFDAYPKDLGPKRTRILIVDEELSILKQADRPLDHYEFSIRFYQEIDTEGEVLNRIRAGIICYQCPPEEEGQLQDIVNQVKAINGYEPFIFVFRSSSSSENLEKDLGYERIMTQNDGFELQQLLDFCSLYEKNEGRKKTHDQAISYHDKEERIYFDKNLKESYVNYHMEVKLREICETYIKFSCVEGLPFGSAYNVDWPVKMVVTVVAELNEDEWREEGMNQYQALIHCIGEQELASVRRTVNQVIHAEKLRQEEESSVSVEESNKNNSEE